MTAVVLAYNAECLSVWTDGAECDPSRDWIVTKLEPKALLLPHLPCIMASLGDANIPRHLAAHYISRCASFDEMVEILPEALRSARSFVAERLADAEVNSQIIVGGWSATRGQLEAYSVSAKHTEPDALPFLDHLPATFFSTGLSDEQFEAAGLPPQISADDLPLYFEAIRRLPARPLSAPLNHPGIYYVGGFLQRADLTIGPEGAEIRTRIIRRWPDEIGKQITP